MLSTFTVVRMTENSLPYSEFPPKLVAGNLCLDFLNTVEWRGNPERRIERLTDYDELLVWAAAAGVLDEAAAERCRAEAAERPIEATEILQQAVSVRENLADLLNRQQGFHTLADVNILLRQIPRDVALRGRGDGFAWRFSGGDRLADVLWPVLWSAGALLTSRELDRLSHCQNQDCGWFFLDHSRNRSRRWCSMDSCGNRAKARRHYARLKTGAVKPAAG